MRGIKGCGKLFANSASHGGYLDTRNLHDFPEGKGDITCTDILFIVFSQAVTNKEMKPQGY